MGTIEIDIPAHRLALDVDEAEFRPPARGPGGVRAPVKTGYLRCYAQMVTSASTGAILRTSLALDPRTRDTG